MDYVDALADLDDRAARGMAPDLSRITDLTELLGDPQTTHPSVHITGTNGKTSIATMITALLGALGVTAGTYTSPHLQDIRERLRVAGRPIGADDFARVYSNMVGIAELVDQRHDHRLTYFEMLTAMAYWWFADYPVDVGVFEVGMGGSWDATNLVRGEVAAIQTIDVDHTELGETPGEVATEKAGIIKEGATVVVADQVEEADRVIRRVVADKQARLVRVGAEVRSDEGPTTASDADIIVSDRRLGVGGQQVTLATSSRRYDDVFIPLHGAHQADNAAVALGAVGALLGGLGEVDVEVVREAFGTVAVPGRLETVHRNPAIVLDGAHNPAAARRVASAISEAFAFRDVILVVASLADKDITGILSPFRDLAGHVVATRAPTPRAAHVRAMRAAADEVWRQTGVVVEAADTVAAALDKAVGVAGETDGVIVTGSLYTVGAARDIYAPFDEDPGEDDGEPDHPPPGA